MITKVLLIDDDPEEHEIFSSALRQYNSKMICISVNSLADNIVLANFLPDVIFLDMNMPQVDGLACLRKIKETLTFKDVPVYMYSTAKYTNREHEAFELGAVKWITKPQSIIGYSKLFEELFSAS